MSIPNKPAARKFTQSGANEVIERSPLRREIDRAYTHLAPAIRTSIWTRWCADETSKRARFAESRRFGPVTTRVYPWSRTYEVEAYIDLLRTQSDHRLLPDAKREALLEGIRCAILRHGGTIAVRDEAHLHLAERRP